MAKVVKRQALRVAGKPVKKVTSTDEVADAPPVKKVVTKKPEKEVVQSTTKKDIKTQKLAERQAEAQAKIDACGYKVGDEIMMKNGRIVKITKITVRPQGVHLWWETANGPSAGGHYTFGIRGKMVDGKCINPISGEEIEMPKPKNKAKAKDEPKAETSKNSPGNLIPEVEVFENEAGDGFELVDGTPCDKGGVVLE